jgi:hypothetical protein
MNVTITPAITATTVVPAVTADISVIKIISVRDIFEEQLIIARIEGLPKGIILWGGVTDYEAASAWTNDSAYERAAEVLALSSIPWAG